MSSISASMDPSEEARLLSPSYHLRGSHSEPLQSVTDNSESEEESDPDGFIRSNQRIFFLLIEALSALIVRLWLATVSVSLLMYILRRVSMHSLVHHSGSVIRDTEVEISVYAKPLQISATPALFGQIMTTPIIGTLFLCGPLFSSYQIGPIQIIDHEACSAFTYDFPTLATQDLIGLDEDHKSQILSANETNSLKWIGLVERGGCPFDQKVFFMQQAGFKSVLVYNQNMDSLNATVRMSAHSMGSEVTVFAAFMSRGSGFNLLYLVNHAPGSVAIGKIEMKPVLWVSRNMLINAMVDMGALFILVVVTGTGFFVFGVTLNLIHNIFVHGQFYALETIHEASLIILAVSNQTPNQPKLKKVEFPRKSLDESSLLNDWRSGGIKGQESCPICIEDFQIGDQVRELPCLHIFHDTCVDPWLLQHNRLCPVCKRDVLRKKPKQHRHTHTSPSIRQSAIDRSE